MKTTVSERGQITVPKKVRSTLALRPGSRLHIELVPGGFLARKQVAQSPWRAVVGMLRAPQDTDRLIDRMRGPVDGVDR
jgi:AbrB family looped-hinge helix DNA binding protein